MTDQLKAREAFEVYAHSKGWMLTLCPEFPGEYDWPGVQNHWECWQAALAHASSAAVKDFLTVADTVVIDSKYDNVLAPFAMLMARELHANAGKGDRPGWLQMSAATAMLEIYYHAAKLQKAVKDGEGDRIREYAADVANMSMMLLDVCGGLHSIDQAIAGRRGDGNV